MKFLNSSGEKFGDKGYFKIEDENVLDHLEFMDIYWEESDLTKEEIEKYNNNYLSFINQVSKYLSQPNIDIKKELEKEIICPKCKNNLPLNKFELILYQKHRKNDDIERRKLKIKFLNCNKDFDSDSITTLLYLYNICN